MDSPIIQVVSDQTTVEICVTLLGGAVGSLVKDVLEDNCLELPFVKDGKLVLGFLGGAIVGAFVGVVVDGSFITALLGGYTGTSVIRSLINSGKSDSRTIDQPNKIPSNPELEVPY